MTNLKWTALFAVALFFSSTSASLLEAQDSIESNPRHARMFLFVPEGTEIPSDYQERLSDIALRTEAFFKDGLELWGWESERPEIFARDESGEIEIVVVQSQLPDEAIGNDALPVIMGECIRVATEKLGSAIVEQSACWVFYHSPDHDVRGFRGMGGSNGGRAINSYPTVDGDVTLDVELGALEMQPLNLKGCVHEFGHALGLPHIGPNPSADLGNTLMGPINKVYASRLPEGESDYRVYLSEASAAMLACHPIFQSGSPSERTGSPQIEITDLTFEELPENRFQVEGVVMSHVTAHSAVLLDSTRGFGDYWSRPYLASVDEDGKFSIEVTDPFPAPRGTLSLYVCLEDGRNSAVGMREASQGGSLEISYEGRPSERTFTPQPAGEGGQRRRR